MPVLSQHHSRTLPPSIRMRRTVRLRGALWCGALLCSPLIACGSAPSPVVGDADAGAAATDTVASQSGAWEVTYRSDPAPIPLNEPFDLSLDVRSPDGGSLAEDTVVTVDARMPAHNHGMNTSPVTERLADGTFHTNGMLFHMPGTWELYVDIEGADSTDRATFVVELGD